MNKQEILENLKKYNLENQDFIIIGSAALVLQGLKEKCNDIDIATSLKCNNFLLKNFKCDIETEIDGYKIYIIDNIINFSTHYYEDFKGNIIDGYSTQTIEEVLKLKKLLNREKDQNDIKLIIEYLNNLNINSLALAYLGDAIYELFIRKYLISKGNYKVNDLQIMATKYVSAKAQSNFLDKMLENNFLTEEEQIIIKRARNHKVLSHPKKTSIITYKKATGLEALLGYLKIKNNNQRIKEIMNYIVGD